LADELGTVRRFREDRLQQDMNIRVPGERRQRTRLCGQALRQLTDIDQRLDACLLTFQAGAPELAALLIEVESVQLPIETGQFQLCLS
jgi:hypothetical protein